MVNAILKLKHQPELREQMGNNSYTNVQGFDSNKIAALYIELYKKYSEKELRGRH